MGIISNFLNPKERPAGPRIIPPSTLSPASISSIGAQLAQLAQLIPYPRKTDNINHGFPYTCHICKTGSVKEICNACDTLYKRGLRSVPKPIINTIVFPTYADKIDVDKIVRASFSAYRIEYGRDPREIDMHPQLYHRIQEACDNLNTPIYTVYCISIHLDRNLDEDEMILKDKSYYET